MTTTTNELRDIAGAVCEQRPDWDLGGVLNVLLDYVDRDGPAIREAAIRAAKHATSRTPLAIGFAQYWTPPRTTPGVYRADPLPECTSCGQPAARDVSARLAICPSCHEPWVPMVFRQVRGARSVPVGRLEVPPF